MTANPSYYVPKAIRRLVRDAANVPLSGDQPMRVLAILALATLLAGCNGDRIKQSKNAPQEQPRTGFVA